MCELLDKPGEIKKIPASDIKAILFFETKTLEKIEPLLKNPDPLQLAAADKQLQELARFHDSRRVYPPLADNPWAKLSSQRYRKAPGRSPPTPAAICPERRQRSRLDRCFTPGGFLAVAGSFST